MPHVDQYVSVTQAKTQLLDLIRRLGTQQDSVGITKDGVPTAVLFAPVACDPEPQASALLPGAELPLRVSQRSPAQADEVPSASISAASSGVRWSALAFIRFSPSGGLDAPQTARLAMVPWPSGTWTRPIVRSHYPSGVTALKCHLGAEAAVGLRSCNNSERATSYADVALVQVTLE